MSRIAKQPIEIPNDVEINIKDTMISFKGPKGEMTMDIHARVNINQKDKVINYLQGEIEKKNKIKKKLKQKEKKKKKNLPNVAKKQGKLSMHSHWLKWYNPKMSILFYILNATAPISLIKLTNPIILPNFKNQSIFNII